jgi:Fe-S cluster biogenesis protein NfuA
MKREEVFRYSSIISGSMTAARPATDLRRAGGYTWSVADTDIKITGEPSTTGARCKFIVDRPLLPDESAFFARPSDAAVAPLAGDLLGIAGVESVLIADNTVTVSATHPVDWPALGIGNVIRKHIRSGQPIVSGDYFEDLPSEGDLKWAIGDLLEREINPAVAAHGGFVELIDVKKNNVYLRLGGGCQGCGAADVTLKQGIEKAIRDLVPRVGEILDTTDHAAGRNPYYSPAK